MHFSKLLLILSLAAGSSAIAQLPPGFLFPGTTPQPGVKPAPLPPVAPVAPVAPAITETPVPAPAQETPAAPEIRNAVPNTLMPEEVAQGWRLLFDGQRLLGMKGLQRSSPLSSGWVARNGELNLPKDIKHTDVVTGGDLVTTDVFLDFEFRFEWKTTASADSGIRYMINESFGQTPAGLEYQIIDDVHNSAGLKGGRLRRSGALDNVLPVGDNAKLRTADPMNKIGDQWNEGRIVVVGTHVEHWMNGEKVLEFELGPHLRRLAEANRMKVPSSFGSKVRTRICILDQGTEVAFRNLKIRPIVPQPVVAPVPGAVPAQGAPNPLLLPPAATPPR